MILDDVDVQTGDFRSRMITVANIMSARRWKLYQMTHDERHAELAEWWREQADKAIARAS